MQQTISRQLADNQPIVLAWNGQYIRLSAIAYADYGDTRVAFTFAYGDAVSTRSVSAKVGRIATHEIANAVLAELGYAYSTGVIDLTTEHTLANAIGKYAYMSTQHVTYSRFTLATRTAFVSALAQCDPMVLGVPNGTYTRAFEPTIHTTHISDYIDTSMSNERATRWLTVCVGVIPGQSAVVNVIPENTRNDARQKVRTSMRTLETSAYERYRLPLLLLDTITRFPQDVRNAVVRDSAYVIRRKSDNAFQLTFLVDNPRYAPVAYTYVGYFEHCDPCEYGAFRNKRERDDAMRAAAQTWKVNGITGDACCTSCNADGTVMRVNGSARAGWYDVYEYCPACDTIIDTLSLTSSWDHMAEAEYTQANERYW